jgi:Na+-transporting methylmalonyl-CoA/oxaloacetate decarboxylase gamma subunit
MRGVLVAVLSAVILGLIEVEIAALVLSGLALLVAAVALTMASTVQRSFKDEIERQSTSARALRTAADDVDSKLRAHDA